MRQRCRDASRSLSSIPRPISHLITIPELAEPTQEKLVNMRYKKRWVQDMNSTGLYLIINYVASFFPLVIVGVALVITVCSINAVGTRCIRNG